MGIWFVVQMIMVHREYTTRMALLCSKSPATEKNLMLRRDFRMTIIRIMETTVAIMKRRRRIDGM